jgi:hypothetical protein
MVRVHPDPPRSGRRLKRGLMTRNRGCSSIGRAPALQAGGHRFDPVHLHHLVSNVKRKRVIAVKSAHFRLVFDQIAVSIFNNSEEAKRFNPAPGDELGEG